MHKCLPKGFLKPETMSGSITPGTCSGDWHTGGTTQCLLNERINDAKVSNTQVSSVCEYKAAQEKGQLNE